jgi:hypothetical protein
MLTTMLVLIVWGLGRQEMQMGMSSLLGKHAINKSGDLGEGIEELNLTLCCHHLIYGITKLRLQGRGLITLGPGS